jgi:hypothetical protein
MSPDSTEVRRLFSLFPTPLRPDCPVEFAEASGLSCEEASMLIPRNRTEKLF